MKRLILPIAIALLSCEPLVAHNNLFFPGDAFFSSKFTGDFLAKVDRGLVLDYERFVGTTAKCGYAGYEKLAVKGLSGKMVENLKRVHKVVFPEGGELPLFVYNRNFPLSSPIGVKYNEHWREVQVGEAGLPRAIYDELGGADFVIDDWASAKDIAPLAIGGQRAPMVRADGETGMVSEPLEIAGDEVMFVVLLGGDGEVRRFARRQEGLVFFVVTDELRRYRFDRKGVAMPQMIDAPLDEMFSKRRKISADHGVLRAAMNVYSANFGGYPTKEQGIVALAEKPKTDSPEGWMALVKKLPLDPWGRGYRWDGDVLFSLGKDGVESEDDVVEPFELTDDGVVIPPQAGDG